MRSTKHDTPVRCEGELTSSVRGLPFAENHVFLERFHGEDIARVFFLDEINFAE